MIGNKVIEWIQVAEYGVESNAVMQSLPVFFPKLIFNIQETLTYEKYTDPKMLIAGKLFVFNGEAAL
jgi:hypothetical protein